jgi:hypothetical protein
MIVVAPSVFATTRGRYIIPYRRTLVRVTFALPAIRLSWPGCMDEKLRGLPGSKPAP